MAIRFIKQLDWLFKERLAELFNDATAWLNGGSALTGTRAAGKVIGDDGAEGIGWVTAGQTLHCRRDDLTAEAGDQQFLLDATPYQDSLLIFEDGGLVAEADYTVDGTEVELDVAASGGEVFTVQYWTTTATPGATIWLDPITFTGSFPAGSENDPYTSNVTLAGGSGTYVSVTTVSGTAPTGITFGISGSNVTASGTMVQGSYSWTLEVEDDGGRTGQQAFTLEVGADYSAIASSILAKLDDGEWFDLDAAGASNTGEHQGKVASKIGAGATSVTDPDAEFDGYASVDFTPNAVYRAFSTESPFASLASTDSYSIGVWINLDDLSTTPCPAVIGQTNNQNASGRALQLFVLSNGTVLARGGHGGTFTDASSASGVVTTNTTYFLQGERTNGGLRLRINDGSWITASPPSGTTPTGTGGNFGVTFGGDYNSGTTTHLNGVNGKLGRSVFFIQGTLTDDEWNYLYDVGPDYAQLVADAT